MRQSDNHAARRLEEKRQGIIQTNPNPPRSEVVDMMLAEALDRISRDQEDIAGIYKRMRYADVKMFTLSEGEISELHVGLKGTMNALFLKDLADKTRRGQRGRVEAGKSGGGNAYGYDVGEYPKLCVSDRAHAVFRYGQASKRPANIMAS